MTVTAEALRFLTTAYDLDRGASRVAIRDGEPVGLVNLGLRGPDAWIGGLGVVPAGGAAGIGRRLMEAAARARPARAAPSGSGSRCIVENTQAVALYEAARLRARARRRGLVARRRRGPAAECTPEEAHAWIREHRTAREPWQRADASLAHQDGTSAGWRSTARRRSCRVVGRAGARPPARG